MYNPKKDLNNAEHPARRKAIRIIEVVEDLFPIRIEGVKYYDLEDSITQIIVEKTKE